MQPGARPLTPPRALLLAALAVGVMDFAYASIFVALRGRPWYKAWQAVASSVLGPASFEGGLPTAILGIALHFTVAACIASVYLMASRFVPILRRRWLIGGVVFGLIAFFAMNLVVVPLTRIGPQPLTWTPFAIGGILIHTFLLGPAAAYFASRVP